MSKTEMAMLIAPALAGVAQGASQGRQNSQNNAQNDRQFNANQQERMIQNLLEQMNQRQQTGQSLQMNRQSQAQAGLNASPLGAEQKFVQKQKLMQTLLPNIQNYKMPQSSNPAIANATRPGSNLFAGLASPGLMQAVSDEATASSLAERRKMLSMVNPGYEHGSMQALGVGNSITDQAVNDWQAGQFANLKAYETSQDQQAADRVAMSRQDLADAKVAAISQGGAEKPKKSGGVLGKILNVAKVVAPIALAATGVGAPLAAGIVAGTNIAASKANGGSWKNALGQGALGAAGGAVAGGALGSAVRGGVSAGTQQALAQGALAGAGSKLDGGSWGDAAQAGVMGGVGSKIGQSLNARSQGPQMNNHMSPASFPQGTMISQPSALQNIGNSMDPMKMMQQMRGVVQQPAQSQQAPAGNRGRVGQMIQGVPRMNGIPNLNAPPSPQFGPQMGANPQGQLPPLGQQDSWTQHQQFADQQSQTNPMFSNPWFSAMTPPMPTTRPAPMQGQMGSGPQPSMLRGGPQQAQMNPAPSARGLMNAPPAQRSLPPGQYNMGSNAGVGPNQGQIPALTPSTQAELTKLFNSIPDGATRQALMRKIIGG